LAAKGHGRVGTPTIKPTYSYHVVPMLGNVAAGEWREVYEQRDETVHIPDVFADPHPRAFGVKPAGNSMDLIFGDKEIAICDPDLEVRDKDIAVVGVNGDEATIKRVFFAGNMIVLHAESSDEDSYPDIAIDLKDPASPPVHMIGRVFWKTLPAKEMRF
ncbi:LexA family protein, partial [Gordonibacter urolithinfaciens]